MTKSTEKKFPTSFKQLEGRAVMFCLVNQKKPSGKSYARYENYKVATNLQDAHKAGFTSLDYQYDTGINGRFKRIPVLCFVQGINISKDTKEILLKVIKLNKEAAVNFSKEIKEKLTANIAKFEKFAAEIK